MGGKNYQPPFQPVHDPCMGSSRHEEAGWQEGSGGASGGGGRRARRWRVGYPGHAAGLLPPDDPARGRGPQGPEGDQAEGLGVLPDAPP
eukprot:3310553-Pyramimonas_sp.AAC.1